MIRIQVQGEPIDLHGEQESLWRGNPRIGAVVTFVGLMRDLNAGEGVQAMTLEHYPGMTERALRVIAEEAARRWDLQGLTIVHRVGLLIPQDPIVLVGVASNHRGEAFQACEFLMDYLKTRAPFWKKEFTQSGERWVEPREWDRQAAVRWSRGSGDSGRSR
jgi:molybdopterin synthase catalytic subunit